MNSANIWKADTSTDQFAAKFHQITEEYSDNNERITERLEEFLLEDTITAGVVKAIEIRPLKNPNRWAKHLAPWFNEVCREAKRDYRLTKRLYGRKHEKTRIAYRKFRKLCK